MPHILKGSFQNKWRKKTVKKKLYMPPICQTSIRQTAAMPVACWWNDRVTPDVGLSTSCPDIAARFAAVFAAVAALAGRSVVAQQSTPRHSLLSTVSAHIQLRRDSIAVTTFFNQILKSNVSNFLTSSLCHVKVPPSQHSSIPHQHFNFALFRQRAQCSSDELSFPANVYFATANFLLTLSAYVSLPYTSTALSLLVLLGHNTTLARSGLLLKME